MRPSTYYSYLFSAFQINGVDLIGLAGGLTFDQLSITGSNGNTLIASGNELLATLTGVDVGLISSADFTLIV